MKIKIGRKTLKLLSIGAIIGILVTLSLVYAQLIFLRHPTGIEGNTTIIRVYRSIRYLYGGEEKVTVYYLDVQHRIYPDSIEVPANSIVYLTLEFTVNFGTSGDWNVTPSDWTEITVDMPRMPSNCSIESVLYFNSFSDNREFWATITFNNWLNDEPWNVGRPLVKILGLYLGIADEVGANIGTPEVDVFVETHITTSTP